MMLDILRIRDFGLLWLAGLLSLVGDLALVVALPIHVYQRTDSTLATAGIFAASLLPRVLLGSVAGVFVDRWNRKRVMLVSNVICVLVPLPILIAPDSIALLLAVSAVRGIVLMFFMPAENALLPLLVGPERLVKANAMNALNDNLGMLVGPALGALLYSAVGLPGVALANSALFIAPVVLIGLIRTPARPGRDNDGHLDISPLKRMVADWRAGLGIVERNRSLRVLFIANSLAGIAEGVFITLGVAPLVLDVLGGTEAQVGWLATAQAIGGLTAGVIIVRIGHRFTKRWLVGGGIAGLGLADLSAFNAFRVAPTGTPAVGVAMGAMVLGGIPSVAGVTGRQSLIQMETTDAFRGRVFGLSAAVQGIAMLIGLAAGGVLGDSIGLVPVLTASALVRVLGGVIALAFLPREETTFASTESPPAPELAHTEVSAADNAG